MTGTHTQTVYEIRQIVHGRRSNPLATFTYLGNAQNKLRKLKHKFPFVRFTINVVHRFELV